MVQLASVFQWMQINIHIHEHGAAILLYKSVACLAPELLCQVKKYKRNVIGPVRGFHFITTC